jgi:hypothetical protein
MSEFKPHFLKNMCAGKELVACMLLGIDMKFFDIGAIDEGEFMLNFTCVISKTTSNGL